MPPLIDVGERRQSACLRWEVMPEPTEHLRAATEALVAVAASADESEPLVEAEDVQDHFRGPAKGLAAGSARIQNDTGRRRR